MNNTIKQITQLDEILTTVASFTHSQIAAAALQARPRLTTLPAVEAQLTLTAEAHQLLAASVTLTFFDLDQLTAVKTKLDQGLLLTATQLGTLGTFLTSSRRLTATMQQHADIAPKLAAKALTGDGLGHLARELATMIQHGQIADAASPELAKVRQQISQQRQQVQAAVTQFVQKHPQAVTNRRLITRDAHICVQLKAQYKNRFAGQVIDQSATGATVFFEPQAARQRADQLAVLLTTEAAIVYQLLATLTGDVQTHWPTIVTQQAWMAELDQIMACGQYGLDQQARMPQLTADQHIKIVAGRHPLLTDAVPLNLELTSQQGLMITGANSGGKTVVLKTIALFALMIQVGLELPVAAATTMPVFSQIWIDIGDNQSLNAQLSTFAAELTTLVTMTNAIKPHALVLLDEIGSGTDPEEGSALSIAIIEALQAQHATIIATTHFSAIKEFAVICPSFMTATMAFDPQTLRPTYHLLLNQVGASEAIWLAQRLGLQSQIIAAAKRRLTTK
ncbi:endonuclease MutS2 [Lactiplantibacillus fabifermentans]|uniref:MutS family ATPase n=2 Tax=Lactiplantibacillus fabifermentans TaxID=483011 RepID=A0A0R2NUV1_9LACO|nr:hypothetical protein [Lactiplantibacillus fabifermentans]ETY74739.1 hypothetical protein LFAB_05495 [Lactiplantibacillus fabifermentans T30PCM01]KRO26938.1 MutS family ATPase [Lactiplantibacillus fabifermentans DSM 21115]